MIGSLTIPDFHIRKNIIVPGCQRLFHAWFPVFVKSLGSVETSCRSREKKNPLVPKVTDHLSCLKMCSSDRNDHGRHVEPL